MNPSRAEGGYTLVELVVVLLLMGFIGVAIAGGLRFGTRVWERTEDRIAAGADIAQAQAILRLLAARASPRQDGGFVTFEGTTDRLTFDAASLPAFGMAGLARVEVTLRQKGGATAIVLTAASLADPDTTREAMLAETQGALRFDYLDTSEGVDLWLADWRDRPRLPDGVRLRADGANASWPPFIAHLGVDQAASCVYDPVSFACR